MAAAASDHGHSDDTGSMDLSDHMRTWKGFVAFVKYSLIGIALIMIFLAMFRTHG